MDVDNILQSINQIELDDSEEEDEEYNEVEEEDSEDEEIDNISSSRQRSAKAERALQHFINNVLTDEQRTALRNKECFFCHKPGHFFRDCQARKVYLNSRGKKPVVNKSTKRNTRPTTGNGKKRNNFKKKSKPVDPYAMVYNFEEDIDEEISDDGNF
jgi:G3E family GTPase